VIGPFFRFIRRDVQFYPLLWVLSVAGVAIGVSGWVAMNLATRRATRALETSVRATLGNATHVIEDRTGAFSEDRYLELARRYSVTMTPVLTGSARVRGTDGASGPPRAVRLVGVDPISHAPIRPLDPGGDRDLPLETLLAGQRIVLLSRALRDAVGDEETVELYMGGQTRTYRVGGYVETPGSAVAYVDIGRAQADLGRSGRISRILLRQDGDLPPIEQHLEDTQTLRTTGARSRSVLSLVSAFRWNVRALAFLSLFVGAFLVYCSMVLYQSRQEKTFSLLRTLGMTSSELVRLSVLAVALLCSTGTIIGLVSGLGLGTMLEEGIRGTIDQLYVDVYANPRGGVLWTLGIGFLLGMAVSMAGGVEPIWRNSRIPPRSWEQKRSAGGRGRGWIWGPGAVVCGVLAWGLVAATESSLLAGFGACFFVALAGAFLAVGCIRAGASLVRGSVLLRMAVRNLNHHGRRTSVMAATLTVAFSMVLAVSLMVGSFRRTVDRWVDSVVRGDFYVRTEPPTFKGRGPAFTDGAMERLQETPGVEKVATLARKTVYTPDHRPISIRGIESAYWRDHASNLFQFRETDEAPWTAVAEGAVFLSEPGAYRMNLSVGDRISLPLPDGTETTLRIAGVFNDYSTEWAILYMDLDRMRSLYPGVEVRDAAVFLTGEADRSRVRRRLESIVTDHGYYLQSGVRMRRQAMERFDRTFAVTDVMNVISSLVAMTGLIVMLIALYRTRRREMGLLRASGMYRRQVGILFGLEAGVLALYTAAVSVPTGYVLSYLLIHVVNRRSFGWLIEFHGSGSALVQVLGLIALSTGVALLIPLWKIARQRLPDLLREGGE